MMRLRGKPNVVRAIDTNVLIRFLTKDDPEQYAKARALIEGGDIFVATTVLLEVECKRVSALCSGFQKSLNRTQLAIRCWKVLTSCPLSQVHAA